MALKQKNRISTEFSMASMSDLVFLLLIFFMISSTLVAPNAVKLLLPESNNQTPAKPVTTISITQDLKYFVNDKGAIKQVNYNEIEPFLKKNYKVGTEDIYISLHAEKTVPWEEVVKIMNIARKNKYKLIATTSPES